jgi:hypothetical protein
MEVDSIHLTFLNSMGLSLSFPYSWVQSVMQLIGAQPTRTGWLADLVFYI